MRYERFRQLLAKHLDGVPLSVDEQSEFRQALQDVPLEVQDAMADELLAKQSNTTDWNSSDKARLYENIQSTIATPKKSTRWPVFRMTRISQAALWLCILGLATAIWYLKMDYTKSENLAQATQATNTTDIDLLLQTEPILNMPDGQKLNVRLSAKDSLHQLGVQIKQDQNGMYYEIRHRESTSASGESEMYTFQTPKGTTSRIRFEDGTEVVLNSQSLLRYPATFSGNERRVSLEGEAYFDVAHQAGQPFIVSMAESEIKVLGTTFNVSAYAKDEAIITTLLTGKVQFKRGQQNFTLLPGEQSISTQSHFTKQLVSAQGYIMWMDGYFFFDNQSIASILETVKRWYDLDEIQFQTKSTEKFSGTFKRSKSLQELLSNLEKLGQTRYKIVGRRVIVMK